MKETLVKLLTVIIIVIKELKSVVGECKQENSMRIKKKHIDEDLQWQAKE